MTKGFITSDGVTHLVPQNTPLYVCASSVSAVAAPPMEVTAHGDVRNWPEFQRELAHLINKHSLERIAAAISSVLRH